jgi:hypothetical protein
MCLQVCPRVASVGEEELELKTGQLATCRGQKASCWKASQVSPARWRLTPTASGTCQDSQLHRWLYPSETLLAKTYPTRQLRVFKTFSITTAKANS